MGHLEGSGRLSPTHVEVLRRYYLSLDNRHMVLLRASGDGRHAIAVGPGESPPRDVGVEESDLQSWCNWSALAREVGLKDYKAAQRTWRRGREVVQEELERRCTES
jgi:hypothetical protein